MQRSMAVSRAGATRHVRLTHCETAPIMTLLRESNGAEGACRCPSPLTAIELEKKKGPRVPKADEHETRPKDLGQTTGQRAGVTDCVRDVRSMPRQRGDRHNDLRSICG